MPLLQNDRCQLQTNMWYDEIELCAQKLNNINMDTSFGLITHLCLSGTWSNVVPRRSRSKKTRVQNIAILGSTINMIEGTYTTILTSTRMLAFDYEQDNQYTYSHKLQKLQGKSWYGLNSRFLTILCRSCVSYLRRSGRVGISNHLRPIYLLYRFNSEHKQEGLCVIC